MRNSLRKICKEHGITIYALAKASNMKPTILYKINKNLRYNPTLMVVEKIYQGSKKITGRGFTPDEYLETGVTWVSDMKNM